MNEFTVRFGQLTPSSSRAPQSTPGTDRGDVPGWVLITLMTAGLATQYQKG